MKKIKLTHLLCVLCFSLFSMQGFAQVFNGTTGPVPTTGTSGNAQFTADVTGIGTIAAGGATLDNVTIGQMTHTFDGDLDISIIAPSGEIMLLSGGNGGAGDNYIGTIFDNLGSPCIESGSPPYTGNWTPEGGLTTNAEGDCNTNQVFATVFDGVVADGTWILNIQDNFGGDSGNMSAWSLEFTAAAGGGGGGGGGAGACQIACPVDITVTTSPFGPNTGCDAYVTIDPLEATGNCDLQTIVNDYNGTANASDTYPIGDTEVCFDIIDNTGAALQCCFTVTVLDNTAPVFTTCPGNMIINLDAGECEAIVNFDVVANDECNVMNFSIHQNGGLTLDPSNFLTNATGVAGGGVVCQLFVTEVVGYGRLFDLESYGVSPSGPFTVESVDYVTNFNSPANPVTVNVYAMPAGTTVPTMAAATLIATATTTQPVSTGNTLHTQLIDAVIPAGMELFVTTEAASNGFGGTIFASEGGPFGGAPELGPSYVFGCPSLGLFPDYTDVDGFFPGYSHMVQVNGGVFDSEVPTQAAPGNQYASGDAFPISDLDANGNPIPVCLTYLAVDQSGNQSECTFCVTVREYVGQTNSLACNDHVNVSLDENCEAIIGADDILEGGPYGCYDHYTVNLFYGPGLTNPVPTSPLVTSQNIGQTLVVQVVDPEHPQNQSCWGTLLVEDKIIPALECSDFSIACTDSGIPGTEYSAGGTNATEMPGVASVDNGTATGDQDVVDFPGASITDIDVAIETGHTWVGDLQISITSPSGTTVELLDNWGNAGICGGCAGNGLDVVFDDESANTHASMTGQCANAPAAEGDYQPKGLLADFDGEDPNGTWTVTVGDLCGGDGGTVTATLIITSTSTQVIPFPLPPGATISPQDIANGSPYTVIGFDPCSAVTLSYVDTSVDGDCVDDDYIKRITRTWTATDASGNNTSCEDHIEVTRSTIADIECPTNYDGINGNPMLLCNAPWAQDTNGHPHPSVTGYPTINGQPVTNNSACEFAIDYTDQVLPVCEGTYKIIRTWTVLAWCPTTEILHCTQVIKVVDNTGPSLTCPANMTVSTGQNDCTASVILPLPTVSDVCSPTISLSVSASQGTLFQNANGTWTLYGLPLGVTTVTYTATDGCGNTSTCTFQVLVQDQVNPVAICETFHVVALTVDEPTLVPALVFDDGSYDNCQLVEYKVRRMDNPNCPGNDATPYGDYVPFYCCDVGGPNVMVELRVRDAAGNTNSCMVEVQVQDKLNPAIQCPPDKVLDCYDDPYDLTITGVATATDNCSAVITHVDQGGLDNCGEGVIFRIWTATDPGGRTASCVQRIDVINSDPFEICDTECWTWPLGPNCNFPHSFADDVEWPCDVELTTCGPGLSPDELELNPAVHPWNVRPRITEDGCDLVAVTYEDLYLPITAPGCVKVLRTWIVIDWCQYNQNTGAGYWEYQQIIKVLESAPPTITSVCEDKAFCSFDANCQVGPAVLVLEAHDDCTADEDLNFYWWVWPFGNQANAIHGFGADASNDYPIGTHHIVWHVEDGCGNVSICEYDFIIEDCKAPTPNLLNGIATELMENCQIEIWANDWDNPSSPSFDNCGIAEWRVFSPSQGPGQTSPPVGPQPVGAQPSWIFDGFDIGTQTVDIWIKDVNGNWAYVSTYILIENNVGPPCPGQTGDPNFAIAGSVETEMAEMVDEVEVHLEGNVPGIPDMYITDNDGGYGFPGLPENGNYVVTPEKDIQPLNGVSTYDLVLMSQHILQINLLNSPYKVIAADVNNSGNVSALDMVELRKLILFINTDFPDNSSWRFVDAEFVFPNAMNPWSTPFPEVYTINGLSQNEEADFVAIKTGDLNDSAIPNELVGEGDDRASGDLVFAIEDADLKAGEVYTVDITAKDFAGIMGYQYTFNFDNNVLEFAGIEAGELTNLNDSNFGMAMANEGVITTSWNNSDAVSLADNAVLFSMTFTAKSNATLSDVIAVNSRYTKAEGYNNNNELLDIAIEFNGTVVAGEFELYQNQPNPFKDETVIGFNLPEAGFATLSIYDVSGKQLKTVEGQFVKGYNEVALNRAQLSGSGVLYYQLDTENDSATKKMILIK